MFAMSVDAENLPEIFKFNPKQRWCSNTYASNVFSKLHLSLFKNYACGIITRTKRRTKSFGESGVRAPHRNGLNVVVSFCWGNFTWRKRDHLCIQTFKFITDWCCSSAHGPHYSQCEFAVNFLWSSDSSFKKVESSRHHIHNKLNQVNFPSVSKQVNRKYLLRKPPNYVKNETW